MASTENTKVQAQEMVEAILEDKVLKIQCAILGDGENCRGIALEFMYEKPIPQAPVVARMKEAIKPPGS